MTTSAPKQIISVAHSPDTDDAFMFYALKHRKITSPKYEFEICHNDIEVLNQAALGARYHITAASVHAYAHLTHVYYMASSGASMAALGQGPVVVTTKMHEHTPVKQLTVAVPGNMTTACLVLKILVPNVRVVPMPFDRIIPEIMANHVDAGLLIHEAQLQYQQHSLHKVMDLVTGFQALCGPLPLPLGVNLITKSLPHDCACELSALQKQSIVYAQTHLDESLPYAMSFKSDLKLDDAQKYLSWYVNDLTQDLGVLGGRAITALFDLAYDRRLLSQRIYPEIV